MLKVAKSQSMFLSLNIDQKIASFESLKEHEDSSHNHFCSTNSQSDNLDIGDLSMKRSANKDDIHSYHSGSHEDFMLPFKGQQLLKVNSVCQN